MPVLQVSPSRLNEKIGLFVGGPICMAMWINFNNELMWGLGGLVAIVGIYCVFANGSKPRKGLVGTILFGLCLVVAFFFAYIEHGLLGIEGTSASNDSSARYVRGYKPLDERRIAVRRSFLYHRLGEFESTRA